MRSVIRCAVIGGIALLCALALRPWVAQQAASLTAWQAVWPQVQQWRMAQARAAHQPVRHVVTTATLSATLTRRLAANGLAVYLHGMPQQDATQVTFRFKAVPFDQAMAWLETLLRQYRVQVVAWKVQRAPALGTVDMQVSLGVARGDQ